MAQVNYKGYARSIGFDPVKAPYGAIDRMQEADARTLRGMQEQRQSFNKVNDQYISSLAQKFSKESQDRQQNYNLEKSRDDLRLEAMRRNAQTEKRNADIIESNNIKTVSALSNFSTTLSKQLTEMREARQEQDMMDGYLEAYTNGLPAERLEQQQAGETLLKVAGERTNLIADGFAQRGAEPEMVMAMREGSQAKQYGRLKAYAEMAAENWGSYLSDAYMRAGISDPSMRAAALPELLQRYLQDNGLFGLKADFLAPAFAKMRVASNALIDDARRSKIVNDSEENRNQALDMMSQMKTPESLLDAFNEISRSYGKDGKSIYGNAAAKAAIYEELSDTSRYLDDEVRHMLSQAITDNGQSWLERFSRDNDKLFTNRKKDRNSDRALQEQNEQFQLKEAEKKLVEYFQTDWDGNEATLRDAIAQAEGEGIPVARLKALLYNSTEQKNKRFWEQELKRRWESGLLTMDDLSDPRIPLDLARTYRAEVKALDDQRTQVGMSGAELKSTIENQLRGISGNVDTDKSPDYTLGMATARAMSMYTQRFRSYVKTMEPSQAHDRALAEVQKEIERGKSDGTNNGQGVFAVAPAVKTGNGEGSTFINFRPGGSQRTHATPINMEASLREIQDNPSVLSQQGKLYVDRAVLKDIDNKIRNGQPISIPGFYYEIARRFADRSALDVLNAQLKAAGFETQAGSSMQQGLSKINDPRLQQLLKRPTLDNLNAAITASGNAPAVVRTGNNGWRDVVALGSASGFKFPMVAAAIWALESGWGRSHSGKNNVMNIKAAPGQGTMMASPEGDGRVYNSWWRDYASPLESVKDFKALMSSGRYAPGLNAAQTPRQAAQAIFDAGYATDPQYVNKVVRVMQGMGINVDQPYRPATAATRNQAYMSPTIAYKIDGIGPTSTGPHLDVKSTTRARFAAGDLDNFVEVQLGKKRVPLGALPITDDFDDHVARGSHGIDYAAPAGTPVLLKNGARVIDSYPTEHGDKLVVQLPDGRRFSFLHGRST